MIYDDDVVDEFDDDDVDDDESITMMAKKVDTDSRPVRRTNVKECGTGTCWAYASSIFLTLKQLLKVTLSGMICFQLRASSIFESLNSRYYGFQGFRVEKNTENIETT